MKITNPIDLRGDLKITLVYPDREVVHFEEKNIITLNGKVFLINLLCTEGLTSDPITTLKIGGAGTKDPEGRFPKDPDHTLFNLFSLIASINVSFTKDLNIPSVTFLADVDTATGNGLLISEAGLFTASGMTFNNKMFPAIPKTNQFSIRFEWTIKVG